MTRLVIPIEQIKSEGISIDCEEPLGNFPVLAELSESHEPEFLTPLKISLSVNRIDDLIKVEGKFETRIRLACSRCLNTFETFLSNRFEIVYVQKTITDNQMTDGEEIELSKEELNLIPFMGEEIDFRSGIQEQAVMAIPMRMLCRKSCRGLCSGCGADLNKGNCNCRKELSDNKFSALRNFKVKKS